jgi:glycosyltransferase involved in cell wall biosynthesis
MVTAVITTFRREPAMVLRALSSILQQTLKDIEVIIVDDSPNDFPFRNDVKEMVMQQKAIHPNIEIRYIQHMKSQGACAARNTGLSEAKGEFIAYLDDDDEWLPEKLEKQIRLMDDPTVALVYCGRYCKNDTTNTCDIEKTEYYHRDVFRILLDHNFVGSTSFPLIRADALKKIDGFDILMKSAQDYDVWLRLSEKYNVDYVDEPLVVYHMHDGEQITNNPQKKIDGLERINEKYREYIEKDAELWWKRNIVITPYYAKNGERKKAFSIWMKCVLKRPFIIFDNIRYLKQLFL